MKTKKGDLSMNTIVMAVIALLILVILVAIVLRNLGPVSDQSQKCPGKCDTNSCQTLNARATAAGDSLYSVQSQYTCPAGFVCCIKQ